MLMMNLSLLSRPLYQSIFFILITLIIAPFLKGKPANAFWNFAGVLYIGFILVNSVFLLFEESVWKYFFISLGLSVVYVLIAGTMIEFLIKLLKVEGSGESGMIFLFVIYHPVVLLVIIFGKWVVQMFR